MQKYSVNQYPISTFLGCVQSKEIAIPEIQRPFVWETKKIRELMDSLYLQCLICPILKNRITTRVPKIQY